MLSSTIDFGFSESPELTGETEVCLNTSKDRFRSFVLWKAEVVELFASKYGEPSSSGVWYYSKKGKYALSTSNVQLFQVRGHMRIIQEDYFWWKQRRAKKSMVFPGEERKVGIKVPCKDDKLNHTISFENILRAQGNLKRKVEKYQQSYLEWQKRVLRENTCV